MNDSQAILSSIKWAAPAVEGLMAGVGTCQTKTSRRYATDTLCYGFCSCRHARRPFRIRSVTATPSSHFPFSKIRMQLFQAVYQLLDERAQVAQHAYLPPGALQA